MRRRTNAAKVIGDNISVIVGRFGRSCAPIWNSDSGGRQSQSAALLLLAGGGHVHHLPSNHDQVVTGAAEGP